MASWDDLYGLIQKYIKGNRAKNEGIVKFLTRKQLGDHPALGSRLTNPLNRRDLALTNLDRETQYFLFKTHEKDVLDAILKSLKYVDEQGISIGEQQLKNLEYNLGIVKMLRKYNLKSEGLLRSQYKLNPTEAFEIGKKKSQKLAMEDQGAVGILDDLETSVNKLKQLADEMKPENIAKKEAEEKAIREAAFGRRYEGRAYEDGSGNYRGLGSFHLDKLHDAGIIELSEKVLDGVKQGKHHWGNGIWEGADPPRIWRYHFGDEIFDKFDEVLEPFGGGDEFIGADAMVNWIKKNKIKPIKKKGPDEPIDYLTEGEMLQEIADRDEAIKIYKSDDNFYTKMDMSESDRAENILNAITQSNEDKIKLVEALSRNHPKAYEKYQKNPKSFSAAIDEAQYKVISEGDEGFEEISKKLGITARPGDKVELESNVIEGPWKGSTKASKLDESKYATDKEFEWDLRSTMLNVVKNDPDFNLEIIERLQKEGDRIYSPYGKGKLLSPDQRQKVLKEIKEVMTDADYQQQWGIEPGTYTDDMFKIDIEEVGKTSKPVVKETVSETIDISTMTNDDLNKLVDEIHMNEGKMAEVDSTGGTKMGYEEFKKLEARNEAIKKALADAQKIYEDLGDATGDFKYDYQLWLQARKKFFTVSDHIAYIKTLEPVEAMKEVNRVLKGEGRYKGISKKDQDQIFTDTNDWVNQRDPSDRWDYKKNRPYRDDPNFDPDDPDYDPDDGLYAKGGRVGFDSGGDPLTRLKNQIVESMKPYAPGISEDRLWIIVKDITLDMSPEQAQESAIANFKKNFAKGGRVGFDSGGWGKGGSNIIDEDWDAGHDDMEGILRLLKQDQTAPQTIGSVGYQPVAQLDTQGLLDLINQKHGAGSLMRGSDIPQPPKSEEIEIRELFNKWNSMYNG